MDTRTRPFSFAFAVVVAGCVAQPVPTLSVPPEAAAPAPAAADRGPQRLAMLDALAGARPDAVGMHPGLSPLLDSIVNAALADGAAPGAALAVGRFGRLIHLKGYGRIDTGADARAVDAETIWDLASLTKVVGTTTAAMMLEEEGRLDLDRTVSSYLPQFDDSTKAPITVRMLLTHRGGLEAFAPLYREFRGRDQYLEQINRRPLAALPGTTTIYSDWDLILLQAVIERIAAQPLDVFLNQRLFEPLGMQHTTFLPHSALRPWIAPTERDANRGGKIWGEVHDPNAWALGGVAGHAGLFSTAQDLAIFAQMMLNEGEYAGRRLLQPATVARWTSPQFAGSSRALGWDTPSGQSSSGRFFGPRSFGHTGYTGTSIWIDPEKGLFVVLLTNRVNPTAENQKHAPLRREVADAVQAAVLDAPLVDWEARR